MTTKINKEKKPKGKPTKKISISQEIFEEWLQKNPQAKAGIKGRALIFFVGFPFGFFSLFILVVIRLI